MKKINILIIIAFFGCAALFFTLPSESSQIFQLTKKQSVKQRIANNVFVPKNYQNNASLFLEQIKNKKTYSPSYEIRLTNKNIHTTSEDWRFFEENFKHIGEVKFEIQISKGAYRFFKKSIINKDIGDLEQSDSEKGLYNCLDSCFSKNEEGRSVNCNCSSWFSRLD